jgi:hypothetical protein
MLAIIAMPTTSITAVASHPRKRSPLPATNAPMMSERDTMRIMMIITGTAIKPFSIALQYKYLTSRVPPPLPS